MADGHIIVIRVVGGLEQREVHDPGEGELLRIEQALATGELHAHGTQQQLGGFAGAGGEEHGVAGLGTDGSRSESDRFLATGPLSSPSSVKDT